MSLLGFEDDYVDLIPDYGLSTLQSQFRTKRLGEQYNKYEQRILVSKFQLSNSFFWWFVLMKIKSPKMKKLYFGY